jgi:hypothetical protein
MDKAYKNLQMVISTKELTLMVNHVVLVSIIGQMAVILKDYLKMDYEMVKECGSVRLETVINTKDNT